MCLRRPAEDEYEGLILYILYSFEPTSFGVSGHELDQSPEEVWSAMCGTGDQWILVSVQTNDAAPQKLCLTASDFLQALHDERGVTNDVGLDRLKQDVLANTNLVFRFTNPKVIEKLPRPCAVADLQTTRAYLAKLSDDKLIALESANNLVEALPCRTIDYDSRCSILSTVLIERGLRLYLGCVSGVLEIGRAPMIKEEKDAKSTAKPSTTTK